MQSPPSVALDDFPRQTYDDAVYRAARHVPWWFCTCGECRFDLHAFAPVGLGTLYAGVDPVTGLLETIGREMDGRPITRTFLAERTIWMLAYDRALELADLCHQAAVGFGVTNELSAMVPYDVPQAWAAAIADQGMDGISYRTRFSTGASPTGIALFDEAGSQDWVAEAYCRGDDNEIVSALERRRIDVEDVPSSAAMTILT